MKILKEIQNLLFLVIIMVGHIYLYPPTLPVIIISLCALFAVFINIYEEHLNKKNKKLKKEINE